MSDRLIYRAWDKTRKEYLSAGRVLIQVNSGKAPTESQLFIDNCNYGCDDRMILEQSTTLTDSEGTMIFEGDILECRNWGQTDEVIGVTAVEWSEDDMALRYADSTITEDFYDQFRRVKIIGNIHTSPELLKGEEK